MGFVSTTQRLGSSLKVYAPEASLMVGVILPRPCLPKEATTKPSQGGICNL